MVSHNFAVWILGGYCDGDSYSLIAKYTLDIWEQVGNLQRSNRGLRAISNGDRFYVVGGLTGGRCDFIF